MVEKNIPGYVDLKKKTFRHQFEVNRTIIIILTGVIAKNYFGTLTYFSRDL